VLLGLAGSQECGRGRAYRADLLGRVGQFNIQAESVVVDGAYASGLVSEYERSSHRVQVDTALRIGRTAMPVSAGWRRSVARDGKIVNQVLARGSLIIPRVALTGFVLNRQTQGMDDRQDGTRIGLLANTRLFGVAVRGEASYRISGPERGLESATVTLEKALSDRSDLRLDIGHSANNGVTELEAGYVRQFRQLALRGCGRIDSRGAIGASLAVSFSVGRDPLGGGWRLSSDKLAQRGQAAVAVFLDENGDGQRSPGEQPLAGVSITAGSQGAADPTDAQGHAFVEGLQPYEKVLISVDEITLPDPFLIAHGRGLVVTPRPGVAAVIELAVTPTGEVEGTLQSPEGVPVPGGELQLLDPAGKVISSTRSEYDGFFLFDRVPYGRYRLRLAEQTERVLAVHGELAGFVELTPAQSLARLGTLRLRRLPQTAEAEMPSATAIRQATCPNGGVCRGRGERQVGAAKLAGGALHPPTLPRSRPCKRKVWPVRE
jgi:hypothetical protein